MSEPNGKVVVQRNNPRDARIRHIAVKLDGKVMANINFGQTKEFEVAPGKHKILVDNTLEKKSMDFDLRPGQKIEFECIQVAGMTSGFLITLLGAGPLKVELRRL
jgi:hypothetical protein